VPSGLFAIRYRLCHAFLVYFIHVVFTTNVIARINKNNHKKFWLLLKQIADSGNLCWRQFGIESLIKGASVI